MSLGTFGEINYLAVLVAAAAYFALGGLWYSPLLFGKQWMEASGVRPSDGRNPAPLFVTSFVAYFVAALAVAFLAVETGARTLWDGILLGLVSGVGFALTTLLVTQAFEGRPARLHLINIGQNVVGLLVVAVIVAL